MDYFATSFIGTYFRPALKEGLMFYSVDLLSLKGGRMNIIWLLGTQRLYHREFGRAYLYLTGTRMR